MKRRLPSTMATIYMALKNGPLKRIDLCKFICKAKGRLDIIENKTFGSYYNESLYAYIHNGKINREIKNRIHWYSLTDHGRRHGKTMELEKRFKKEMTLKKLIEMI